MLSQLVVMWRANLFQALQLKEVIQRPGSVGVNCWPGAEVSTLPCLQTRPRNWGRTAGGCCLNLRIKSPVPLSALMPAHWMSIPTAHSVTTAISSHCHIHFKGFRSLKESSTSWENLFMGKSILGMLTASLSSSQPWRQRRQEAGWVWPWGGDGEDEKLSQHPRNLVTGAWNTLQTGDTAQSFMEAEVSSVSIVGLGGNSFLTVLTQK